MKIIEKLSEMIAEELNDAEKYVTEALQTKDTDKRLADVFYDLSGQEMEHAKMLHGEVTRLIEDYKSKNGAPPESMLAVYNYLHRKQVDHASHIKAMIAMYR